MTVTNHVLAGALIGLALEKPIIALPLALASHIVMDAVPHFGYKGNKGFGEALQHSLSYWVGYISLVTTIIVILLLAFNQLWLALFAGLIATLPDVLGVYNYQRYEKHGKKAEGILKIVHVRFHRAIQRYERPWGVYIELVTFGGLLLLLLMQI